MSKRNRKDEGYQEPNAGILNRQRMSSAAGVFSHKCNRLARNRKHLVAPGLVDILLGWDLIFADEILRGVLADPVRELGHLLPQAIHGLLIHVGLGDELW